MDLDDIEDIVKPGDLKPSDRYSNKKNVVLRVRKKNNKVNGNENEIVENGDHQSVISGTQTIYVKTWGCSHNNSDSEYMAGQLAKYGYSLTNQKDKADLWLLNSCTVKNPSEDTFRNDIQSGLNVGKKVVVAGCVPQGGASKQDYMKGLSIVGVNQIDRVVEVVEETLKGNTVKLLQAKKENGKRRPGPSLLLPKIRKNPLVEIIPINSGCLNQCTYCKTKHARGDLVSYPPEEIVQRAKDAFEEGVVELWLTSEDTGTYGRDIDSSLPELLYKLVEVIPEGCKMRIGMTNPPYILEHLEAVADILKHSRVYSFLHVPVQAGSDSVLGEMKREYCIADFEKIVDYLKEKVPGVTIATDIICGFPTETPADFEETMTLCAKYKFPSLFINQFFPRPGTPAANMKRIPPNEVKQRTKKLTDLFYTYEPYSDRIGMEYEVLVTEISHDKKHYVGHNKFYEQILLPMRENLLGKSVNVKVISSTKFSMMAEIINSEDKWKKVNENVKEDLLNNQSIGNGFVHDSNFIETNGEATNSITTGRNDKLFLFGLVLLGFSLVIKFYLEYKKRSTKYE
ncbi:threonylcarbamoyladenosine tRNA methylthiotransferase [Chironomus tepperi]|uniref:threonylcarbamoyladenosine tRNA methylthiotransferase n=1 Tax=Chironomus tepperi TaxID=113505 RepID=UPI00391F0448